MNPKKKKSICLFHRVLTTIQLNFKNRDIQKQNVQTRNPWVLRLRNTCAIGCSKKTAKNIFKSIVHLYVKSIDHLYVASFMILLQEFKKIWHNYWYVRLVHVWLPVSNGLNMFIYSFDFSSFTSRVLKGCDENQI